MDYYVMALPPLLFILVTAFLIFKFLERHELGYLRFLRFIASWPFHLAVLGFVFGSQYITQNETVELAAGWVFIVYIFVVFPLNYSFAMRGRRTELQALERGDNDTVSNVRKRYEQIKIGFLLSVIVIIIWNLFDF